MMDQKILITRPIPTYIADRLRKYAEVEIHDGPRFTPAQLHEALLDKNGVLVAGAERVASAILKGLSRLKAVCVSAAGYNLLGLDALTRAGIMATNAPGISDETVA